MKPTTTTYGAMQDVMNYCGAYAPEAAAIVVKCQDEPIEAQMLAKALIKRIIASGSIGGMPAETLHDLAMWAARKPTEVKLGTRCVTQIKLCPGDKLLLQELADMHTGGNQSAMLLMGIKTFAGISF